LRWQWIANPESSGKKTSGWVLLAQHVGEYVDDAAEIQSRVAAGELPLLIEDNAALFPIRDIVADNISIFAAKIAANGKVGLSEVSGRDVVVRPTKPMAVLFRGLESELYTPKALPPRGMTPRARDVRWGFGNK
jgi:hypothetical protein